MSVPSAADWMGAGFWRREGGGGGYGAVVRGFVLQPTERTFALRSCRLKSTFLNEYDENGTRTRNAYGYPIKGEIGSGGGNE